MARGSLATATAVAPARSGAGLRSRQARTGTPQELATTLAREFPELLIDVLKAATEPTRRPAWWDGFEIELRQPSPCPQDADSVCVTVAQWETFGDGQRSLAASAVFVLSSRELEQLAQSFEAGRPAALERRHPGASFEASDAL